MRKIMIFATFRFELLKFESGKTLDFYSFGALFYPPYIFVLIEFRCFNFVNELGLYEEGLLACRRSGYLQHSPSSYYIFKVEKR